MFGYFNDRRFGLLSTRLLLLSALAIALLPFHPADGQATHQWVTFLSQIPESNLTDPNVMLGFQIAVGISCLLWLMGWLTPYSCWLAVLSLGGLTALRIENADQLCHAYHLMWWLLLVHAAWYTFYFRSLTAWGPLVAVDRSYPYWVFWLCVLSVVWLHCLSGLGKWQTGSDWATGWQWADGVSLQLWIKGFGNTNSPVTQWLMSQHGTALAVQRAMLLVELGAVLAVLGPVFRRVVGAALLVYYLFLIHCFVDLSAGWSLLGAADDLPANRSFPVLSLAFQAFWTLWFLLIADRGLGPWRNGSTGAEATE